MDTLSLDDHDAAPGDRAIVTDTSLNFGDLSGRAAILKEIRDDEDGYNYRVSITDTIGLPVPYETWVADVVPERASAARHTPITTQEN